MKRIYIIVLLLIGSFVTSAWADYDVSCKEVLPAGRAFTRNCQSIRSWINFYDVVPAKTAKNLVNAVVTMPAGTNVEWQVDINTGVLAIVPSPDANPVVLKPGQRNGHRKAVTPSVIEYLGVVGNYAIVPRTTGPLEVLVIGGPMLRSSVTSVKLIGAIQLRDESLDEDTYKLIAVLPGTPWASTVNTLADLDVGATTGMKAIIQTWFENYKGRDADGNSLLNFVGFMDAGSPDDNFTNGTAFGILNDSNTE